MEGKKNTKKKRRWSKDDTELTLMALPTTIWYLLFCFLPMFGAIIAFKNYRINGGFIKSFLTSEWVGLDNFKFLFSTKDVWIVLRNTLGYNIICNYSAPRSNTLIFSQNRENEIAVSPLACC